MKKSLAIIVFFFFLTTPISAEKYYWVGGTGNWSELEHWSPESGNANIHHGVIPTYNDTVYFDVNSFSTNGQVVTVDVENAICMRMDWTNAQFTPKFESSGTTNLSIFGDFLLTQNMTVSFTGNIYFESTTGITQIKTLGKYIGSNLFFNGTESSWQVDSLSCKTVALNGLGSKLDMLGGIGGSALTINAGTLVCESKNILVGSFSATSGFDKELFIDNSRIVLGSRWIVGASNLIMHNSNALYTLLSEGAQFYAGEGNHYKRISFENEGGTIRYVGGNCEVDSLFCSAGAKISGNGNLFQFLSIAANANFEGNNTFGRLWLSPNNYYKFQSEKTQTILTELIASGECSGFSHLYSSSSAKAIIAKADGNVLLTHVLIENIEATGGAIFRADNSAELQENPGWIINESPRTLYWVGGTGHWDNAENWSLTSGGVGGACIPFHIDEVVFDNNSFQQTTDSVYLNTSKAYCNNMTWETTEGMPTFFTSVKKMRIFGSLELSENMDFSLGSEVHFLSQELGNTIKMAGHQFKDTTYFKGEGGEWTMLDSLDCAANYLYLTHGTLKTNNQALLCSRFVSDNENIRSLELGSSIVTVYDSWKSSPSTSFDFLSGTSLIKFTSSAGSLVAGSELQYYNILFTEEIGKGSVKSDQCTFNKATFLGNGKLLEMNFFDTLELTAAKVYTLDAEGEQNINTLMGEGSCSGYIFLNSSIAGTRATITKQTGRIDMNYLILKDIDATNVIDGFFASNSIDMGNNTACTIISSPSADLFWVGGNGNWADEQNWSYTSGGSGGACIPSPADNVFFDSNSFSGAYQSVFVNLEKAFCNNMEWSGVLYFPTIKSVGTSTLSIYASLKMVEAMDWAYNGDVVFDSETTSNTITSLGNSFQKSVSFQGGGTWGLVDSITVNQSLNLTAGRIRTNNHPLNAYSFFSASSFPSVLEIGNSIITIGKKWEVRSDFTLTRGDFIVRMMGGAPQMVNSCSDSLLFNNVYFLNKTATAPNSYVSGTTKTRFKNIYFSGAGELKGSGVKTADTIIFTRNGKLAETNKIIKVICNTYGQIWNSSTIDTLILKEDADIMGTSTLKYVTVGGNLFVTGQNEFGYCKIKGNGDVFGSHIFGTLIFTPDKRYVFEGGKTQKILKEFEIRGNNCRHIYFLSSSGVNAKVEKTEGSVHGDFIEMQNITGLGGASFYAGNFNHSDNIANSCIGWDFEDEPGYIYGLEQDTIITKGEQAILSTENLNGDDYTTFRWNTGDETIFLEVTDAGLYSVTANYGIVDGSLCEYTDDIIVHFAHVIAPLCFGEANGEINIISDDSNKYDFIWQDNSNLSFLENIAQGEYSVEVTDKLNGRKTTRTFNLSDGLELEFSVNKQNASCNAFADGRVAVSLLNGIEPYTYRWVNYGNQETHELLNLPVGEYYLELNDAHCSKLDTIVISEPEKLSIRFETKTDCSNSTGGEIVAHATGGNSSYTYSWKAYSSVTDSTLSALSGSQYYVLRVVDKKLCELTDSIFLSQPEAFSASVFSKTDEVCVGENNGAVQFSVFGGVGDYTYLLDNEIVALSNGLLEAETGHHSMKISDQNNCLEEFEFEIKVAENAEISIQTTDEKCALQNGQIQYTILSDRSIKEINWTNSQNDLLNSLENLSADWYFVHYSDENNCLYEDSVEIFSSDCNSFIEVPNVFTPNGDGLNDLFRVSAKSIQVFTGVIVNRWGRQVFSWNDYLLAWNGKLNGIGNDLSSGVYYYIIKAIGEDGTHFNLNGYFYLER